MLLGFTRKRASTRYNNIPCNTRTSMYVRACMSVRMYYEDKEDREPDKNIEKYYEVATKWAENIFQLHKGRPILIR